jgi:uncharacterized membrane protein YjjP (DUF1212 family)
MISSYATHGTSSTTTFDIIVSIGGKRGLALVDSGSTNTFIDYTFASKICCNIVSTTSKQVSSMSCVSGYQCSDNTNILHYLGWDI